MAAVKSFSPAQTGGSRVFLIDGRARPDHKPAYQANMKAGGISQSFGDIERIEIPSPDEFGKFLEVGTIRGATERVTITLTGRYASDLKSTMLKLARKGCSIDVHINFGLCTSPTDYNVFTKKIVIEDARVTDYSNEDLGALGSDEQAKIDESIDVSGREVYELVQVTFAERGGDVITNEVLDVVSCDTPSCGDCEDESDGCEKFYAISTSAGGSPSTPADLVFTLDGGRTWRAHDIDTLSASEAPNALGCLGQYVVVVSSASGSLHYVPRADLNANEDPAWTEVSTGFVTGGSPRSIDVKDGKAFIAGNGGYIYSTEDPTSGVEVLDAGVLFPLGTFNKIRALSDEFAVAVGNGGAIVKTENGVTWGTVTSPVGVSVNLTALAVKSKNEWWIGGNDGVLRYTLDGGDTWNTKGFSQSGSGTINDIFIANDTVMYVAHTLTTPRGRLLRSTNGGYDFTVLPEGSGTLPLSDRINAVAACQHNPDIVVAVGLADNGSDGYAVVGSD